REGGWGGVGESERAETIPVATEQEDHEEDGGETRAKRDQEERRQVRERDLRECRIRAPERHDQRQRDVGARLTDVRHLPMIPPVDGRLRLGAETLAPASARRSLRVLRGRAQRASCGATGREAALARGAAR